VTEKGPGDLVTVADGGRGARPRHGIAGLDGSDYEPWSDRNGLVLAADRATHTRATTVLAPDGVL
jgi:hypothetical protein